MWRPTQKNELKKIESGKIEEAEAIMRFSFPFELKRFYEKYGYGSFLGGKTKINRLLDPLSVADLRKRINEYEFYVELDLYQSYEKDKLLFFEADEGVYFAIEINDSKKQRVYLFDNEIAGSLDEFLRKYSKNNYYYLWEKKYNRKRKNTRDQK